ncbi:MAG TPA: BON domain-containing protein [Abditibacterium sp.]|jgi:hypothetical protein
MKTSILLSVLALGGAAHAQTAPEIQTPATPFFRDVPPGHWAFAAVQKLAGAGIVEGYAPGTPETPLVVAPMKTAPRVSANLITPLVKTSLGAAIGMKASNINVDFYSDRQILVLNGTVKTEYQKKLAENIARKDAPQVRIFNRLRVAK